MKMRSFYEAPDRAYDSKYLQIRVFSTKKQPPHVY